MSRKSKPGLDLDRRPPVAVSYIRFSTPEQRKGNSLKRQTADTEAWCERNGIPQDRELSCLDAGRSAYHGRHRDDKAALGRFLEYVREGRVPRGSFLVIENLDRLSREDERTALRLWLDILDAGVNIVQLHPETVFRHERSDMVDIMRAIIELSRGHSESRVKSVRSLHNWSEAVRLAREKGRPVTGRLPSWVELTDSGLALIPERAAVVRNIFALARSGYGYASIVKKLNAEGVPAFGDRVPDENGGHRKADGQRFGCGEWRTSYVRQILSDRRATGRYQPRDAQERPKGEPIEGYYPRCVSAEEFFAARAAIAGRKAEGQNRQGRIGAGVPNLFSGLLRDARDGSTFYAATRSDAYGVYKVLRSQASIEARGSSHTFPYAVFERAVLSLLREIDPRQIVPAPPATEVSVLQDELNRLRRLKAALMLQLREGDEQGVPEIAEALRQARADEAEVAAKIDENAELTVVPRADRWRDMQSLIDVLDGVPEEEKEDARLRLRAAVRRNVESAWLLIIPKGRDRLCAAQLYFAGDGHRDYLIFSKAGWANASRRTEGGWQARTLDPSLTRDLALDLRDPSHARRLAEALAGAKVDQGGRA
jgi:DNA invertase Pin-like site-specific DNA recombinase